MPKILIGAKTFQVEVIEWAKYKALSYPVIGNQIILALFCNNSTM